MGIIFNSLSCFLRCQPFDCKVSGLAQNMTRQIVLLLLLYQLTHIAPESALICTGMIACHWKLENISTYYEKAVQVVRIQELPSPLAPACMRMLTHQF